MGREERFLDEVVELRVRARKFSHVSDDHRKDLLIAKRGWRRRLAVLGCRGEGSDGFGEGVHGT